MSDAAKTREQLLEELAAERALNEQLRAEVLARVETATPADLGLESMACILWRGRVVDTDGRTAGLDDPDHKPRRGAAPVASGPSSRPTMGRSQVNATVAPAQRQLGGQG